MFQYNTLVGNKQRSLFMPCFLKNIQQNHLFLFDNSTCTMFLQILVLACFTFHFPNVIANIHIDDTVLTNETCYSDGECHIVNSACNIVSPSCNGGSCQCLPGFAYDNYRHCVKGLLRLFSDEINSR